MYNRINKIGKGYYGEVYNGINVITRKNCAIKTYHRNMIDTYRIGDRVEVDFMSRADHPNIVKITDVYFLYDQLNIVMDLADCNLEEYLSDNKIGVDVKITYCNQFLDAIKYVHHNGYIHSDLKLENILLYGRNLLKLTDFGKARRYDNRYDQIQYPSKNCTSSISYRAPEFLTHESLFISLNHPEVKTVLSTWSNLLKAEYYSIGRVLLDIITNDVRCTIDKFRLTMKLTFMPRNERLEYLIDKSSCEEDLCELVCDLLSPNPNERSLGSNNNIENIVYRPIQIREVNDLKPVLKICADIANDIRMKPVEFAQALSLYYVLLPYGMGYVNLLVGELTTEQRVMMIMAISMVLVSGPTSYDTSNYSIFVRFIRYISHSIDVYKFFIEDAYTWLKGVVIYEHIGLYTKQFGAIGTWLALRYYIDNKGLKMKDYVDSLAIQVEDTNDYLIGQLGDDVFNSLFI